MSPTSDTTPDPDPGIRLQRCNPEGALMSKNMNILDAAREPSWSPPPPS
jgi:hypothetical protein